MPAPFLRVDYSGANLNIDAPVEGASISGLFNVTGWAFDNEDVSLVEILLDDALIGTATYGVDRADVATVWPNAPRFCGFQLVGIDSAPFTNAAHRINVRITDSSYNVIISPDRNVTFT